ncbi:MAG: methylmalonyl-CoA mutase family protein [bacterium]
MSKSPIYPAQNHIRIVAATSLFDGHDASINIMRRIFQSAGAEVIHLGHNRSVQEIVHCAIQEDAQAIAVTSYQGGHLEFFKYMYDMLQENQCGHIKIFGGGGGVILPDEIEELHQYGIARIFSPDDGRKMGLLGMIHEVMKQADFPRGKEMQFSTQRIKDKDPKTLAETISAIENYPKESLPKLKTDLENGEKSRVPVLGITGTGGAGKSSLVDEFIRRFLQAFPEKHIAIVCVDPTKRKSGGALLGDRNRMNAIDSDRVFMRSMATRQTKLSLSAHVKHVTHLLKLAGFDLIIIETSGIGQSDTEIVDHSDLAMYVMTPEYGAASQLEKIDMLEFADIIALNKFEKKGGMDALRDVKKQYQRNHLLFEQPLEEMPVYGTIASQFNDPGVNQLFTAIISALNEKLRTKFKPRKQTEETLPEKIHIIPPGRVRYLAEIADTIKNYNQEAEKQSELAQQLYSIHKSMELLKAEDEEDNRELTDKLQEKYESITTKIQPENLRILNNWDKKVQSYKDEYYVFKVRDKEIKVKTHTTTLSHLEIPKITTPRYKGWGDILKWNLKENVPGEFPFTAGVFPFKRENEDPTRMFAGEGGPERTNKRFHYLSKGLPAKRLSTAFDSVTLYGNNPDLRPDIYGKVGNSGVSVCCLDDAKKLYSGFNLADPSTSVSMTINGPAPMLVGYFLNTAIDQQCEIYIKENGLVNKVEQKIKKIFDQKGAERPTYQGKLPAGNDGLGLMLLGVTGDQVLPAEVYEKIKLDTMNKVRGTVQADILKEDQGQNTCIFSTDFALKLMGDIQEYFIENNVRNFYSVSISGYHIAEAGANPISQLAFTLANGFTYVEYYLSRGMDIDKFAPNLSFFFSNGIDIEFSVIGRVARTIWAKVIRDKYKGNTRSQQLKYHIQTSGRSLHAQEIGFNDIRTTLQALYAIYDNCNSLHTNAFDEAITTPTEDSVRRAMAIQLIINHELGLAKNQNPLQGSFIIEELTDLVEEAVMLEFDRISERGGVLGAMETAYQRNKIQDESLYYEHMKHSGKLPIMGVNTFLSSEGSPTMVPEEVIRSNETEKKYQISMLENLHKLHSDKQKSMIEELTRTANKNENIFTSLMEATKYCSLGQITQALYDIGGQYRRSM